MSPLLNSQEKLVQGSDKILATQTSVKKEREDLQKSPPKIDCTYLNIDHDVKKTDE